jgi:glycosyltransferase involved in cell wall biosynthesis
MKKKALFVANTGFSLYNFRLALMKYLNNAGWYVTAAANDEAGYVNKFADEGIKFINLTIDHKGKNPISDFLLILKLYQLYRREMPDLVHHSTIKPVIYGSIAANLTGVPAIVNTITGLGYVFLKGGIIKHMVVGLYKIALNGNSKTTFQNYDDYNYFVSKKIIKSQNSIVILGSGVNTDFIHPTVKSTQKKNLKYVLISRMLKSKGIVEYIKVAERIKKQFPNISFQMAGGHSLSGAKGNPDIISINYLRDVNKTCKVRWLGRIRPEKVMDLLDNSDVVVLPSYYPEGIPRTLIEAAAKGKAIITTDMPGCREIVVDGINGFLVPPKNIDALESAMIKFIRNPELIIKMGAASRKRAIKIFDEKIIIEQMTSVYKEAGAL